MHITFYGAVREVTGSMHLLATANDRILLDCGLFQGRRRETAEKNSVMPVDPHIVTNMILSHAHIDHSGRLPLLAKRGFAGRIVCTRATAAACEYLLLNAAHIQESDANYLNYKTVRSALLHMGSSIKSKKGSRKGKDDLKKILKKNRHDLNVAAINDLIERYRLEGVKALYTIDDAQQALSCLDGYPYRYPVSIGRDMTCTLYDAGHILGSALTMIRSHANGRTNTICYTGDIGRFDKPIINDPTLDFEEEDQTVAFADSLKSDGFDVVVPRIGETISIK